MADIDEDELLADLGIEIAPLKASSRSPREERIVAGFEDILRFHQTHGRVPQHGECGDIFERLYAVRLDQLRKLPEAVALLAELDTPGLLAHAKASATDFATPGLAGPVRSAAFTVMPCAVAPLAQPLRKIAVATKSPK